MLLIVLCYAIVASTFTIGKAAIAHCHPLPLIGIRMLFGGAILLLYHQYCVAKGHYLPLKKLKDQGVYAALCKIAFFHIYFAFSCEFWALQYVTSAKTNLIYATTPFIAAALSYFLLKERLSGGKILAILVGIAGIAPVSLKADSFALAGSLLDAIPEIVLFAGVASASYAWFDIKKWMQKGLSIISINAFSMIIGGFLSLITAFLTLGEQALPNADLPLLTGYIIAMVVTSNIVFYNLYGYLMHHYSITFLTFCGFLSPLFGALYGYYFLGEEISWHYGLSFFIIFIALALYYREEKKELTTT